MDTDAIAKLKSLLMIEEGFRQYPYKDTTGNLTIGFGRNLTANGISPTEASLLLDNDIDYFIYQLKENVPTFSSLDDARQIVLIDMCFNLGLKGLLEFKRMFASIASKDWDAAAREIQFSKAAIQTGTRYDRLAQIMKTGSMETENVS